MAFCIQCGAKMIGAFCVSCGARSGATPRQADCGGMVCYHHQSVAAVAQCAECDKGMCKDCYDSYGAGMGAGKALCFGCTEAIIENHAEEILDIGINTEKMRKNSIIGMIVGGIIGAVLGVGIGAWPGAGIGGTIGSLGIGFFFSKDEYGERSFGPLIFSALAGPIYCIFDIIKDRKVLAQCQAMAASEQETLRLMRDYFEYTLAMGESAGVDLASLANQGGTLFGNSYASAVISKGEKSAQIDLRQGVAQIAANGEIIRNAPRKQHTKAS